MSVASILSEIREKNKKLQEERIEEIYKKIPEIKKIDGEIKKLSVDFFKGQEVMDKIEKLNEEKKKILKDEGIPLGYLDLQYNCDKCKDQGFIIHEEDGRIYQEECSCRKNIKQSLRYDTSSIRDLLSRQNFDNFDINLFSTGRDINKEEVSPRENIIDIKNNMEEFTKKFPDVEKGILFYGPTGTGKTFMCSSIAKEIIDRGFSVLYQTSSEILDFMATYSFMFYEGKLDNKDRYDFIFDADLLIIDDLGSEYINEKTKAELFKLINLRMNDNKPVVISSNIDLEEIEEIYGSRIFSRILGEYNIYKFIGNDIRLHYLFD